MQCNNLQSNQSNNTHNASFEPNPAAAGNQQPGASSQASSVPPLQSAADLSANPAAKNLQTYNTSSTPSTPQGPPDPLASDNWSLAEYQPIQPGAPYMEKLADDTANKKRMERFLKHAQECEADGDFQDAEKNYKKALKHTENAEHYKAYATCLQKISTALKDATKERTYKEKAARAFYYLGDLYKKQGALQEAQAAYKAACELALHEAPLQALVDVARQVGEKSGIAAALEKLADFYTDKGDIDLAIQMLKEAVQVETSFKASSKRLQKLEVLCSKNGGAADQSTLDKTGSLRFKLQTQILEQKIIKQKAKIGTLKGLIKTFGEKNKTHNASFAPNTPSVANQQQGFNLQARPVPPLAKAVNLFTHPSAKNIQTCNTSSTPQGPTDYWNAPEYQPIKPGLPYMEKLADDTANKKRMERFLKHAQECEVDGDFQDAEKNYKKALKHTENADHYKAYATCLQKISTALKDATKASVYKEKAARAFYYLGDLYKKQGALQEAQAAYKTACDLVLHEAPLQALVDVARQVGEKSVLAAALEKLADFYTDKGDIDLAIQMLKEAVQVETSFKTSSKRLQKLEVLCSKNGGAADQSTLDKTGSLRFKLQTQILEQKIIKQKAKIGTLKGIIGKFIDLDLRAWPIVNDQQLIPLLQNIPGIQSLNLAGRQFTDASLQHIAGLSQLKTLNLSGCHQFTDASLQHIAGLSQLKTLNLSGCHQLTDAGLKHIAGLSQLSKLDLSRCTQLTGSGLEHLVGLSQLSSLNLQGCGQLTNAGLQHLAGLSQLRDLNLCDSNLYGSNQLTDAGLQHIARLYQLSSLDLGQCPKLTDAGLKHLAGLSQLTSLGLTNCKITDSGLEHLAGLSQLSSLCLTNCEITDAGLKHLAGLSQLSSLNLSGCFRLTDAGLQHLADLTPQLTSLVASGCQLTNAGLQHLAGLSQLSSLKLIEYPKLTDVSLQHLAGLSQLSSLKLIECTKLTGVGLQHLAGLSQLSSLNLKGSGQLTDAGLQHIAGLSQLTSLDLTWCKQLTDVGLQHLAGLSQLSSLNLKGSGQLTDAGLQHIAGLSQLTSLDLTWCTQLTDSGLEHLAGLSQLRALHLIGCKNVSSNAKEQLKKQIPGLTIHG